MFHRYLSVNKIWPIGEQISKSLPAFSIFEIARFNSSRVSPAVGLVHTDTLSNMLWV